MENEQENLRSQIATSSIQDIKNLIYTVRGKQVMLDSDVAMLYDYKTKRVNETVRRNKGRFPEHFCFQLTEDEVEKLKKENNWSQIATSSNNENNKHRGKKYLPYVFTEQGIAMLSGLLKNDIAIQVSIRIMDAFVEMRNFLISNGQLFKDMSMVKGKIIEYDKKFDKKFDIVFNELQKNKASELKHSIFFQGQIWDSYSLIVDIIKRANNKILIIDNYMDDSILKMLAKKKTNVEAVLLTSNRNNISQLDIQKFNEEYPTLKVSKTNKFHDRFIVIDSKELYHCGASLKDLGKKCFGINKIEDNGYINRMSKEI